MNNSPIRFFIPTLMGFCLMGGFLWNITNTKPATVATKSSQAQSSKSPILLVLKSAHLASHISIYHEQNLIWQSNSPSLHEEISVNLPDSESYNMHVKATWPVNTPDTAVSMILEKQGKHPLSDTKWSFGSELSDIYQFSWK